MNGPDSIVIAITGASGAIYGQRFLREALGRCGQVNLVISAPGAEVIGQELGIEIDPAHPDLRALVGVETPKVTCYHPSDLRAPFISGSQAADAMVIVPCSLGTAGRIASGVSDDVITRAADVMLKERRPLILVPRETPLNLIHLRNLTALAEAGAVILPAMPGFYQHPASVDDLVDFVVARIWSVLENLGDVGGQ